MKPSKTLSSAASPQNPAALSMNGKTSEEWEASRISGPLSKQEMFVLLKKLGKLPADAEYKKAS
ncbi:hypothetical protein Q5H92_22210 [Hymenobacter sp. M29]|uniref:GYF domain-containing protein n=1 Tax=Hymenobacter mellowenesis TaxID=3063995 RepID=A0ABT9AHQ0_9BACT|nr:hypothetical protein [Hymenobacter sp. M29]MDO7849093.1 hypothetical protein [Hymenobacter sp. M29]